MSSLLVFTAIVVYAGVIWRFWAGFNHTNFNQQGKLYLSVFWPFFLVSKSYRQNFTRALKGK
jgi:hypothetical protein